MMRRVKPIQTEYIMISFLGTKDSGYTVVIMIVIDDYHDDYPAVLEFLVHNKGNHDIFSLLLLLSLE